MNNWYSIFGLNPEPWQASEGSVGRKSGKLFVAFHKPEQLRNYQEALKEQIVQQNKDIILHEGNLDVTFYFWRELASFDTGTKKSRAHYADATNLVKSTEDALQGILYKNDRIIRSSRGIIVSQDSETEPAIVVNIKLLDFKELIEPSILITRTRPDELIPDSSNWKDRDVPF